MSYPISPEPEQKYPDDNYQPQPKSIMEQMQDIQIMCNDLNEMIRDFNVKNDAFLRTGKIQL